MPEIEEKRESGSVDDGERKRRQLKYLDFVELAAIYAVVCVSSIYEYAKENSGPLRPGVQAVEGTVKTVIGPVHDKFHDVPFELIEFVDRKVGDTLKELDRHVPSLVKRATYQARAAASEVQRAGLVGAAKTGLRSACETCETEVERLAAAAWRSASRVPLVARVVVPTASYCSDRYNRSVCHAAERGYTVASYAPLIPRERIARVFRGPPNTVVVDVGPMGVCRVSR